MTPQQAYEEDVRRRPAYFDGSPRKAWAEIGEAAQRSWQKNPTPRNWLTNTRNETKVQS